MDECGCEKRRKLRYYRYYDSPEGCDIVQKTIVTTRYGMIGGFILGTYDVLMFSHAVGLKNMLRRYQYHMVPLALMGATFSVVANSLVHYRDVDDMYNYFYGGMACGPILAAYLGSYHAILLGGLAMGAAGMIKKFAVDNKYELIPDPKHQTMSGTSWRLDCSLSTDPRDEMRRKCGTCSYEP